MKLKHLPITIAFLLLGSLCTTTVAQEREVAVGLRGGHNVVHGAFSALSVEGTCGLTDNISVRGGAQYATYGRTAIEVRPTYSLPTSWGTLHARTILHHTAQASFHNVAAGVGVGFSNPHLFCSLGYYYRLYGSHGEWLNEPFNIFYELGFHLLPRVERWDLQLVFTNSEMFDLERHYQPSWIVRCDWEPSNRVGLVIDLCYKSAGMFNMSADYYQLYLKAGLCYKW